MHEFRRVFNFQVFGDFMISFYHYIYCNITISREHTLCDFNSLKCVKVCFITEDLVCLGECATCT